MVCLLASLWCLGVLKSGKPISLASSIIACKLDWLWNGRLALKCCSLANFSGLEEEAMAGNVKQTLLSRVQVWQLLGVITQCLALWIDLWLVNIASMADCCMPSQNVCWLEADGGGCTHVMEASQCNAKAGIILQVMPYWLIYLRMVIATGKQMYECAMPTRLLCNVRENAMPSGHYLFQDMWALQEWFAWLQSQTNLYIPFGKSLCIPCANGLVAKLCCNLSPLTGWLPWLGANWPRWHTIVSFAGSLARWSGNHRLCLCFGFDLGNRLGFDCSCDFGFGLGLWLGNRFSFGLGSSFGLGLGFALQQSCVSLFLIVVQVSLGFCSGLHTRVAEQFIICIGEKKPW